MKTCQSTGYFQRVYVRLLICFISSVVFAGSAYAFTAPNSIDKCYDCHGSPTIPGGNDLRPVDATYRNITTGGFVGNHRTHIPAVPSATNLSCVPCHGPAQTKMDHRSGTGVINMRLHINSTATVRGYYNKPVGNPAAFLNQTSAPVMSTCNNVNCHFRTTSPAWGATPLTGGQTVANCQICHLSTGMNTGDHTKHIAAFGNTITACSECHPDNTTFTHATSAKFGRSITVTLAGAPFATGTYAASTHAAYPNYFTATGYGSCNNVYCHSSVQSATGGAPPVYKQVTWGLTSLTCSGCHGNTATTLLSGSHTSHLLAAYAFACTDCHGTAGGAGNTAIHANGSINVDLTNRGANGTYSGDSTPQNSNFGVCNNTNCHGKNSGTWGTAGPTNGVCTTCHGQLNYAYTNVSASQIAPGGAGVDTGGNSVATAPRVGAHQGHLTAATGITGKIRCSECHIKVLAVTDPAHLNYTTATVTFQNAALAVANSHTPTATKVSGIINCNNTYCHTGKMNSGTGMTPVWTDTAYLSAPASLTATDCKKCHGLPPSKTFKHASTAVVTTVAQLMTLCSGCHSATLQATGATTFLNVFKDVTKHINGNADATSHTFPYPGGSPLHKIDAAATPWAACNTCHSTTATGTTYAQWVLTGHTTKAAPNCTTCHINTLKVADVATGNSCWDCHGPTATNGWPNGTVFPNNNRSHGSHSALTGITCAACHNGAGSGTVNHGNAGAVTKTQADVVVALSGISGTSAQWTLATETCSSSNCHGQKSPAWGTTASPYTCTKCHGNITTNYLTNYSSSIIAPGGVGRDTAGNTATTFARVGTHQQHLLAQSNMSNPVHCGECHTVHTTVADATHLNYTTSTITFGLLAKTAGHTPTVSRDAAKVINCSSVYCHEGNRPAGSAAGQRGNITTVWAFNGTSVLDNSTVTGTCTNKCHGLPPGSTGQVVPSGDNHFGLATPTTVAGLSICSSQAGGTGCHPTLKIRPGVTNFVNMTSVFMNKGAEHIDGIVQGGTCTGCHKDSKGNRRNVTGMFSSSRNSHHYQGTAPIDGKVCYACHWEAKVDGTPDSAYHKSSTSGSPVALVIWNGTTRPTGTPTSATLQYYSSGGASASSRHSIGNINNHCLGCHNDTNKTTATFTGDTGTPSMYSWEALPVAKGGLGATAQSIAVKYTDLLTTTWGKFTGNYTNARSGVTKAFSAHGNAKNNQRGWSTLPENAQGAAVANYPNSSAAANSVMCYDCHNSHGSDSTKPANAVTTSYSSVTGRGRGGILKTTVAGKGGYIVSYRPYTGGNATQKNVFKTGAGLCFDCHNNANAASPTSAGYTSPWGYQGVFGVTQIIHGYNDNPYFGKAGGSFAKGVTFPYIGTGRPNNLGGHFGASFPLTTATNNNLKIGGLCTPCHDPHGVSPGILAANKQYAVPMLKETFVTSPYKQDAAAASATMNVGGSSKGPAALAQGSVAGYHIDQNTMQAATTGKPAAALSWVLTNPASGLNTLTDTQFAGLCLKCHAKTSINSTAAAVSAAGTDGSWLSMKRIHNSVDGWALTTGTGGNVNNTKHAYTCSKCHSTHNSNLPRLLVTNCLDVKHRGRGTTGVPGDVSSSGSSGAGAGRFPYGGGGATGRSSATNPGPWWFGASNGTSNAYPAVGACHNSGTAGGTTYNATSQQWNTKSLW